MTPERVDCAVKMLRAAMEAARRLHPQLGLSFGYIGNLEFVHPRRDDRCWSVFSKLSTKPCATGCNISWARAATSELGSLAVAAALGDVFDWAAVRRSYLPTARSIRCARDHGSRPRSPTPPNGRRGPD